MTSSSPSASGDGILTISTVIVNWNTRDLLRACLRSLPWGSAALRLEVIVVDNGSSDDSAAMVEAEFPQVRLIRNADNVGFVRANNQGLAAATGDWLFMLNSDTEVREGAIERLAAVAGRDLGIGAVGPRLLNSDGTPQVS
ncbi:MAG: glycosyltransferase, partial [Armatimonadota bacterium]